jgi:hypothetical protein
LNNFIAFRIFEKINWHIKSLKLIVLLDQNT